MKKIVEV